MKIRILEEARAKRAEEAERQAVLTQQHAEVVSNPDEDNVHADGAEVESQDDLFSVTYARIESRGGNSHLYKVSEPLDAIATPDPDSFFVASYNQTLASMITHVVEIEGPVREDLLAKRIARAHGWIRTGARIRERILKVAKNEFVITDEDVGLFVWPSFSSGESWVEFRRPDSDDVRAVDEISMPELVALAREVTMNGLAGEDAVTFMAREVGLKKLMANSRERLERALDFADSTR